MITSLRQYALRRGSSVEAVSKAVSTGRLQKSVTYVDGYPKINDCDLADREWTANTRARADYRPDYLPEGAPGSVYFVRCETPRCRNCGHEPERSIKVGFTSDVEKRVAELQIGNPFELALVHSFESADPRGTERILHDVCFDPVRVRGEWFREGPVRRLLDAIEAGTIRIDVGKRP